MVYEQSAIVGGLNGFSRWQYRYRPIVQPRIIRAVCEGELACNGGVPIALGAGGGFTFAGKVGLTAKNNLWKYLIKGS
jgi:hypothetical protein